MILHNDKVISSSKRCNFKCSSNNRTSEYPEKKLIELKREIDKPAIIVGYFNTPILIMSRKEIETQ